METHPRTERGRGTKRNRQREIETKREREGERGRNPLLFTSCNARAAHIKQDSMSSKTCGKKGLSVKEGVAASLFISSQRGARKFVAVYVSLQLLFVKRKRVLPCRLRHVKNTMRTTAWLSGR